MSAEPLVIRIADVKIGITGFPGDQSIFLRYLTDEEPDLVLHTEDLAETLRLSNYWLELHRMLAEALVPKDMILFHASVIAIDGEGIAYTAPSGTGKSTHSSIVKKLFGEDVAYVNDDKPFLVLRDGEVFATGSPWSGKHHIDAPLTVPLRGIVFLRQAAENRIERLELMDAYMAMLRQTYRPAEKESLASTLSMLETVVKTVPCYRMGCTISDEAARLSVGTVLGARHDD